MANRALPALSLDTEFEEGITSLDSAIDLREGHLASFGVRQCFVNKNDV